MASDFTILLIGINHRTAPVEIRERLSFNNSPIHPLELIKQIELPIKEAFFLSTCNRVEFIFVSDKDKREDLLNKLEEILSSISAIPHNLLLNYLYFYENKEAIRHLFEVACGLDSMVLGEPQILGQLKDAYRKALELRTCGLVLNKVLHRAFFVAKRVRTETGIGGGAVSVSFAAVQLAKKVLGSLKDKKVLLIGAGEMAELACQHLISNGAKEILIANRTLSRAVELAEKFKGKAFSLEELPEILIEADIVISSTGAPGFVINKSTIAPLLRVRKFRPLFIIDIAVPRDVDPEVNQLENVYLFDIDDLKEVVEENLKNRKKEALRAKAIIEEEVLKMEKWLAELSIYPTIRRLAQWAEGIRQKELEKTLRKLKNISDEEKKALEVLTISLVQKLLQPPILFLKNGYHEEGKYAVSLIREVYRLDETQDAILEPDQEFSEESLSCDLVKGLPEMKERKKLLQ